MRDARQETPQTMREEALSIAQRVRLRADRVWRIERVATAGALFAALATGIVIVEMVWRAPVWGRFALAIAAVCGAAALLAAIVHAALKSAYTTSSAAGLADAALGRGDGPLRSAVELAQRDQHDHGLTGRLTERAVERGVAAARALDVRDAVDERPARRAIALLLVALAAPALVALATPQRVSMHAMRLVAPLSDRPPYTPTRLSIAIGSDDVRLGDDVPVIVRAEGEAPEAVDLVVAASEDAVARRLTMRRADGGGDVFEATLRDLRSPLRLRAESGVNRSRWIPVDPAPRPRLRSLHLTIDPPDYTARSARTVRVSDETAATALAGSRATLRAGVSIPIDRVDAPGADEIAVAGDVAVASWRLEAAGESRLAMNPLAASGAGLDEPTSVRVEVVADAPPAVRFIAPIASPGDEAQQPVAMALPARVLRLVAEAQDDVAVASLGVEAAVVEDENSGVRWRAIPGLSLPQRGGGLRFVSAATPEALGADAGQRLLLRATAIDARPERLGGPQRTTVGPLEIHIVDESSARDAIDADRFTLLDGHSAGEAILSVSAELGGETMGGLGVDDDPQPTPRGDGPPAIDPGSEAAVDGSSDEPAGQGPGEGGVSDGRPDGDPDPSQDVQPSVAGATRWQEQPGGLARPGWPAAGLNRLPERYRDVASRYYELLAGGFLEHDSDE